MPGVFWLSCLFFEEKVAGPVVRLTQFLGHRMSYHNDILLVEPKNSELTIEVVQSLCNDLSPRTILHLRNLASESVFTKQLLVKGAAETHCSRLLIKADSNITDQAMRLSKSTRKTFRRCKNKLFREYDCEFDVRSGDEFSEAFDEFINLHQQRFASVKRTTLLEGLNLEFLKTAISRFDSSGNFEIVQLCANGKTIAAALIALSKRCCFAFNSGFNPEFSCYSPMRLLRAETMRHVFDDLGCKIYDFGPGYERHKYEWKPFVDTNYFCSVGGSGPYAKLLASLYRVAFRRQVQVAPKNG